MADDEGGNVVSMSKQYLIEMSMNKPKVDISHTNEREDLARLLYACRTGDVATAQSIVAQKTVDLNALDGFDASPLILASLCGHITVVQLLLESGAVCQRDTFQGERCLYSALNDRIRNLLLSYDYTTAVNALQQFAAHLSSLASFIPRPLGSVVNSTDLNLVWPSSDTKVTFKVHRFVAIARSPYLRRIILELPMRNSINLPTHVSTYAYELALRYMYLTDMEVVAKEQYSQVEAVANLLEIPQLLGVVRALSKPNQRKQCLKDMTETAQKDFEMLWFNHILPSAIHDDDNDSKPLNNPTQKLANLITGADIIIQSDFSYYPVHKVMLDSEWFATMFSSGFRESAETNAENPMLIHMAGVLPSVMELILEFLYSDDLKELPLSLSLDLLYAADMLFIDRLKGRACSVLATAGNIDDLITGEETGFSIFDVIRAAWATRMRRIEESSARYIADRMEHFLTGPTRTEFLDIVMESASRIKERQETDSIELIDDIRYYLGERFRMMADEFGSKRIFDDEDQGSKPAETDKPPKAASDEEGIASQDQDDNDDNEGEDGLKTGTKKYHSLMVEIDVLLEQLNLDA